MGPKLKARMANISGLSAEELDQLIVDLTAAFDLIDDQGGSNDDLIELADAIDEVKAEQDSRTSRQSVRDRVHASTEPQEGQPTIEDPNEDGDSDDDEDDEEDDGTQEDEEDPNDHVDVDGEESPVPVAASSRPPRQAMAQHASKRRNPTPASRRRVTTTLVAGGDVAGHTAGAPLNSGMELAEAITAKLRSLGRGGSPDRLLVASVTKEYPDELTLGEDPWENEAKINAEMQTAMVASGGICEPPAIDYSVNVIGSTARPLQAGLPSFAATRGGVKYNVPPTLADVVGTPSTWTIQDDIDATPPNTTPRKNCFRVECGPSDEAYVYGIPVCLEVGNMMGRFTPEWVNAQQSLLDIATARMAELELLTAIEGASTAVTSTGVLGAVRHILPTLDQLFAAYNYRNRLTGSSLRAIVPEWVRAMMRADLAMEMPGGDAYNQFAVTDAQVNGWFTARNANPIWTLEDSDDSFGAAQAAGALNAWPTKFKMTVFAEGTFQYLDGGRIDLGVVRDSELNSRNDYQIWREDFEGIAKRGNESLTVEVTTKPTGMSAGTLDNS